MTIESFFKFKILEQCGELYWRKICNVWRIILVVNNLGQIIRTRWFVMNNFVCSDGTTKIVQEVKGIYWTRMGHTQRWKLVRVLLVKEALTLKHGTWALIKGKNKHHGTSHTDWKSKGGHKVKDCVKMTIQWWRMFHSLDIKSPFDTVEML